MRQRYELKFFPTPSSKKIVEPLGPTRPYLDFDLELNGEETAVFQRFDLSLLQDSKLDVFNNFGDILLLEERLKHYLEQLGKNTSEDIALAAKTMTRLSQHILDYFEQDHGWISLKPSLPNEAFKIPRWHHDGYFYSPHKDPQAKVVMALKGPSTLFYEASEEQREIMDELDKNAPDLTPRMTKLKEFLEYNKNTRKQLAQNVFDLSKAVKAVSGHGTIFTVGSHGAVHSEPDMNESRLFFSVLPGTPEQIAELYKGWNPPKINESESSESSSYTM